MAERVAIADCPGFSDDSTYAAMDFLLDALSEIAASIFDSVAHLLNLDVDIIFVDGQGHVVSGFIDVAPNVLVISAVRRCPGTGMPPHALAKQYIRYKVRSLCRSR
ncbi:MAG: hypothetical protein ACRDTV_17610 [Mycobacterium sp.]